MREMGDGSIVFPHKGNPPVFNDPRYEEDPDDPFRFVLKYCPCVHRELNKPYKCRSGKTRTIDFCKLLCLGINPKYCQECKRDKNDAVHQEPEKSVGSEAGLERQGEGSP